MMRQTWEVDREKLQALVAKAEGRGLSMHAICVRGGMSGNRTSPNWPEDAVRGIAEAFGIDPLGFATPRAYQWAQKRHKCPKVVPIPADLRDAVEAAAKAAGVHPVEWMQTVIRGAASK